MKSGFKILDSDMHLREPADLWEKYMEPGWRELTPYSRASADGGRRAMVRVEPRRPADLGLLVARWAVRVRS